MIIIKGDSVAGGKRLADHLERADTNEKVIVVETKGVVAEDIRGALQEMEAVSSALPNCQKPFYHASINPEKGEPLTAEQRDIAIDRLATKLGLEHQPRVVVAHVKDGREHFHIVFSRIDMERMRVISDSHNYRKHEEVARSLEREFGREHVQGAHVDRNGKARPERTPSHAQMQQAERTKLPVADVKAHLSQLYNNSENGAALQKALHDAGYTLAKGDRRDFVVIDFGGGVHSLSRMTGSKAQDVRNKLADIDREALPSVDDQRKAVAARTRQQTSEYYAAHSAVMDSLRLGGNQSMAKIQQVQLDVMKRRAEEAYRNRFSKLTKDGEALKEKTEKQIAKDGKIKTAADALKSTDSTGKGDTEQERD